MKATFERRRLLSRSEAQLLFAAEKTIQNGNLKWRVMAQVSLGEVLSSPDARAYSTINSKRVDLLIISSSGDPIAAVEYQGGGHYQGTSSRPTTNRRGSVLSERACCMGLFRLT